MARIKVILSLFLFVSISFAANAVEKFEVSGWVKQEDKTLRNAVVEVYKGEQLIDAVTSNRWGNFNIELELGHNYNLLVRSDGMISKNILFQTNTAEGKISESNNFFEFIVNLKDQQTGPDSENSAYIVSFDDSKSQFVFYSTEVSKFIESFGAHMEQTK